MMRTKRRRKSGRFQGSQTHKRGHRKRTRGSGNRGGKGMAGTGKRGDQRKTWVIKMTGGNNYFGKSRTLRRGTVAKKLEVINLAEITSKIDLMVRKGTAKGSNGKYELNLEGYKVLGDGETKLNLKIKASAASKSAQEKIKAAGGEIVLN